MRESDDHRWRVLAVYAVLLACAALIVAKLFLIQVVQHDHYLAMAQEEHWLSEEIPAERGTIFDCGANPLAASVVYESLFADTMHIDNPGKLAEKLATPLQLPQNELRDKLSQEQLAPTLIADGLSFSVAQEIRNLKLSGVYLLPMPKRAYPEGNLAAQVLGLVGRDNQGLSGIESHFNSELGGEPGVILAEKDTDGQAIALTIRESTQPTRGHDLLLTIDRVIQRIAERELEQGISNSQAKSGSVVVMEPKTGAILALANWPSFDFADPDLFTEDKVPLYRNPAVSDMYEPGSIFKFVTMAAGLDSGAVTADEAYLNTGSFTYGGGTVKNAISRPQGMESMTQILVRSSNIGAAYVATKTGDAAFYRYLQAFGFGEPTGIELPGEAAGILRMPGDSNWSDFDLATNSFGQGISVTPLQMACATAAVANGGTLMKPWLIKQIDVSPEETVQSRSPVVLRQVITPTTAQAVTDMLVETVSSTEGGTIRESYLQGYNLAGKTGTAEIPDGQGYDKEATIASYAGFGPAEDPRFVIVVKIVEPQTSPWAEAVAAPIFRDIARQIVNYYGIPPAY